MVYIYAITSACNATFSIMDENVVLENIIILLNTISSMSNAIISYKCLHEVFYSNNA